MTKQKPLSPEAKAAARALIDEHIRSFCEWSEQRKAPIGVLALLRNEPREA